MWKHSFGRFYSLIVFLLLLASYLFLNKDSEKSYLVSSDEEKISPRQEDLILRKPSTLAPQVPYNEETPKASARILKRHNKEQKQNLSELKKERSDKFIELNDGENAFIFRPDMVAVPKNIPFQNGRKISSLTSFDIYELHENEEMFFQHQDFKYPVLQKEEDAQFLIATGNIVLDFKNYTDLPGIIREFNLKINYEVPSLKKVFVEPLESQDLWKLSENLKNDSRITNAKIDLLFKESRPQ